MRQNYVIIIVAVAAITAITFIFDVGWKLTTSLRVAHLKVETKTKSCAIVFSSGALLKHSDGPLIDTFDEVIRINAAPTIGYEDNVGNKTTFRAVHMHPPGSSPADWFAKLNDSSVKALTFQMAHEAKAGFYNERIKILMNNTVSNWTLVPIDLQMECNSLIGLDGIAGKWCTTGMQVILWAVKYCGGAVLFGLDEDPCYPYHYWDQFSSNCTKSNVPAPYNSPVHNFVIEHKRQIQMHEAGNLTINRLSEATFNH